ncbi:hypothetical protein JRO89_XS06G0157800 [Xanthoceras sorbifolium]|uniref:PGG domain-containing protein n=1 Tax=Xanthoceras sorbifolium TaxID=99658 RepID=A0ABQ8HYH0_9ROSI|nr:hypothetical protein JRO89_XS06G0157800 [Xanthoceras sorbifolium]
MKAPYQAVIREDWEDLKAFFDSDNAFKILFPMTVAKDTPFHMAVHSKTDQPLRYLLERVEQLQVGDPTGASVFMTNDYENTVLHEAAINSNIAALLVEENYVKAEQLLKRNRSGQTPLFKAASVGSTKVVRYLASQRDQTTRDENNNMKLEDTHRIRNDGISILHAAVRGEHFGHSLSLSLYHCHIARGYGTDFSTGVCIPTGHDNNDDANNIDDDDGYVKTHENNGDANNIDNDDRYVEAGDNHSGPQTVKQIWEEERKRKFAFELARKLIKNDESWQRIRTEDPHRKFRGLDCNIEIKDKKTENSEKVISENKKQTVIAVEDQVPETPLLAATRTGMIEIVREILKEHPQAVEHISHKKQNILHVAASYRQREVFELVKEMKIPTSRLILGIDDDSYTVLQHVADTVNYHGGTRYGPAYQLQEELEWFKRVEDIMPSFFTKHRDKRDLTAKELFIEKHSDKLQEAQKWLKQTSQSCSQVAVLVATVVFAAAFTVPGGTDDKNGTPILLNSPFFLFFSISDVISLSSSLTAVVMFLSILTSSFELYDFHRLLPRRLTLGFALLFMSVATTMLAFTSTVILIIHLDKRRQWTLTLICCAAYFPVSVLALTHFPLFASFVNTLKDLFMAVWEAPPCRLVVGGLASVSNSVRRLLPKKNSDLEKGKD